MKATLEILNRMQAVRTCYGVRRQAALAERAKRDTAFPSKSRAPSPLRSAGALQRSPCEIGETGAAIPRGDGNKCAALDRQIDALVYELYGLTPEEIELVEGAAK